MGSRFLIIVTLAVAAVLACGAEEREVSSSPPVPTEPIDVSGSYEVKGVTTELRSGATRDIQGMLILAQTGNAYTASFHMNTLYPTADGTLPAEVVGQGDGTIEGNELTGTAEIQLIFGIVPGAAAQFPLAPRIYGPRLVSASSGSITADGTLSFETTNEGAEGEEYPPTRTTVSGARVPSDWAKPGGRKPGD